MHLTRHTDYALRLLIHLAGMGHRRAQIAEVAALHAISRSHLMKIANQLARAGIIEATRGRGGGIRLARDPAGIGLAQIIAITEPRCAMVDCGSCRWLRACAMPGVLEQALDAFEAVLSRHSLADIIRDSDAASLAAPLGCRDMAQRE